MGTYSRDSHNWDEMVGVYKKKKRYKKAYIPSDPKLKAVHLSGKFLKRAPQKIDPLGKEIKDFYAKQRQAKKPKEGRHKA